MQESGDPSAGIPPDSTVVPAHGELTFFSASGSTLRMANGVATLEAKTTRTDTATKRARRSNYRLTPLADDERQLFETVQANTDTLAAAIYVGDRLPDGIRLCKSMASRRRPPVPGRRAAQQW